MRELAKGKSVTASTQQAANAATQGNDGDTTTRWAASGPSSPQWWRVDLGANHRVVQVSIRFEHPERTYYYSIETSTDDAPYAQRIIANGTGVTQDLTLPANVTARYVRITVTNGSPLVINVDTEAISRPSTQRPVEPVAALCRSCVTCVPVTASVRSVVALGLSILCSCAPRCTLDQFVTRSAPTRTFVTKMLSTFYLKVTRESVDTR